MQVVAVSEAASLSVVRTARLDSARPRGRTFDEILSSLRESNAASKSVATYTVRPGESLWSICASRLKQAGRSATPTDIQAAITAVAGANGLRNPDLIRAGQRLNLSSIALKPESIGGKRLTPLVRKSSATVTLTQSLADLMASVRAQRAQAESGATRAKGRILAEPAQVSSGFGYRRDPFTGRRQHHNGVDLAVPTGTPVYAYKSGTVSFSGWKCGYGNVVMVSHGDGTETVYGHNSRNRVQVGDQVDNRTTLALSGSSGRSTGPHLHFEVRVNGRSVDPEPYLAATSLEVAQAF
ncbi:MAG TPA: peptidoglycan DD-metalloendopeptidase family protein [Candidatus Hydrogenedentes bacterium]|nr:peptidoglycan DD-metalloendopeptidase family protein [Candidatus Hydrogenedentota bacterium]HPG67154.1 peptidoglycan DD-metalloendopeptidase family protein [Candidatus Hydrogenedentota bacterium]